MNFSVNQSVNVAPALAVAAYGSPAFYEGRAQRDDISVLDVVTHQVDGRRVLIEVRFKFTGSISSAVRAVIDPNKMSWITRTEVYLDELRTQWKVLPEHYPDRLTSSGTFRFSPGQAGADSTAIEVAGQLKVNVFLVGRTVEQVIVRGLRSYLAAEVASLPDFTPEG